MRTRLFAHAEVCRVDTLFYVGPVAVAGALLTGAPVAAWQLVGVWLVPTLGWVASLYGGDFYDRDLDAGAKPHRPIPSGRMSPRAAFAGMWVTILLGGGIAVALDPRNLVLVLLAGALGVAYSRLLKARGILGNLVRGGPTALALILGALSVSGTVPVELLPVALLLWIHDSSSNLIGALCDTAGDAEGGYRTFPVRHGDLATLRVIALFDLAWFALAVALPLWWPTDVDTAAYAIVLLPAVLLTVSSVRVLVRAGRPVPRADGLRAHELIVIERLCLPSAFIAGHNGLGAALAVLLPTAALTIAGQAAMRHRYEPNRRVAGARPGVRS
ncbi:UbiA family prenyltransferase [Amycolatopsis sp. A1MSW2902]|uniref:UbiA family prenyltransferase n=1 Tax=Amycolatopsis sp. A1MSW2902 TaxID=687413 RepID=UPI00307F04F4